jgi:surface carbohydrate biosynthesis protein
LKNKYYKRFTLYRIRPVDIVIFDSTNSDTVCSVIPEKFSVKIFDTRPVKINLNLYILCNFLFSLRDFSLSRVFQSKKGLFYNLFWQLQCIYISADIKSRKPKAVITFIDNCCKFAWLSKNLSQVPCIAIQNGFRLSYSADDEYSYYCNYLFCFGQREIEFYPKLNYRVDQFFPFGSLSLSNNFCSDLYRKEPIYDLLIVSCWRGNIGYQEDVVRSMRGMKVMDELLYKYLIDKSLNVAVILRSERNSEHWVMPEIGMSEEEYYKSIYGDLVEIIDVNFSERNVYPTMQKSKALISGFSTTCLVEAFSFGKKVLYANFCGTNKYHRDFAKEILFEGSENDKKSFYDRIDTLLNQSSEEYLRNTQTLNNYYVRDPRISKTASNIKEKISKIVNHSSLSSF